MVHGVDDFGGGFLRAGFRGHVSGSAWRAATITAADGAESSLLLTATAERPKRAGAGRGGAVQGISCSGRCPLRLAHVAALGATPPTLGRLVIAGLNDFVVQLRRKG